MHLSFFKFSLKNNSDDMALGENRTLILDVILPKDVEANVRYDTTSVFLSKTINAEDYKYLVHLLEEYLHRGQI